jgi:hypothetical protein
MRRSIDRVAELIKKGKAKSDISLINCLRQKEALMKTYLNRALRNQDNLRAAFKANDEVQSKRFVKLIKASEKKVRDIESSLKDCKKGEIVEDGTKVKVIKPEGLMEQEDIEEMFPEDIPEEPESMPLVPPSSPYE